MKKIASQEFPEIRRSILSYIKQNGSANIAELSTEFNISYEAVRQQIVQLEKDSWIVPRLQRSTGNKGGRPIKEYYLTTAGDHIFDKHYDLLAMELIQTAADKFGQDVLKQILATLVDNRVKQWTPRLSGLTLEEKLKALRDLYLEDDPFMQIEKDGESLLLIERNCPFLNVATRYPMLCSVTVSTLSRLLGVKLKRVKRFQDGDTCCAFKVLRDVEINKSFRFELENQEQENDDVSH